MGQRRAIALSIAVVAIIHLIPVSGVLGAEQLHALYGIPMDDPNLAILMQHRAVLFGLLGVYLLYSLLRPQHQWPAMVAAAVSVLSFLLIALSASAYNEAIARVVNADWIALACLALAAILKWRSAEHS